MTGVQLRILKRYTRVRKGWDKGHEACLVVDHQCFVVGSGVKRRDAQWTCDQLAIALSRMIEHEEAKWNASTKGVLHILNSFGKAKR